jgi:hypothetical protein
MAWEEYIYRLAPRWLRNEYADALLTVVGGLVDVMIESAKESAKLSLVSAAGSEGVRALARERMIEPLDGETAEALRARAADAWTHWGESGTDAGLTALLRAYSGVSDLEVLDVVNDGSHVHFEPGQNADAWSRLWVSIPDGNYVPPTIGSGLLVGPSGLVGVDMTVEELRRYRRIFRRYKPAHVYGAGMWVNVSAVVYDPADPASVATGHAAGDIVFIPLHVDSIGPQIAVGAGLVVGHVYH